MTPADIPRLFAEHWNNNDAAALAALFVEDADFVNVVGLWWRRRHDIERAHKYALDRYFKDAKITLQQVEVRHVTDDVATVHARWRLDGQRTPTGEAGAPRSGVMLFVAKRDDDRWVSVAAHNTDLAQGAETNVASGKSLKPTWYG